MVTFRPSETKPAPAQTRQRRELAETTPDSAGDRPQENRLADLDAQLNSGSPGRRTSQLKHTLDGGHGTGQRMEFDEDELQMKADGGATVQRCGSKEEYQRKASDTAQRMDFDEDELLQSRAMPGTAQRQTDAPSPNQTGMPDGLKSGIESLSGMDMSDVKVHTDSPKPAQIDALAYAQGNDIHLGPGQEQHLPHEAWHVVQQRQGRVRPTLEADGVPINDDRGLEREADVMGQKALGTQLRKDD